MAGSCDHCGAEEYMPYVCKFCKGKFCAMHRLPENHACAGLGEFRDRMRTEGRVFAPNQENLVTPRVSRSARAGASMDAFWSRVDGKMTYIFLGVMLAVYILEFAVISSAGADAFRKLFVIEQGFLNRPWTVVTSMFAHDPSNPNHIIFNGIALYFFGSSVERILGSRRFTYVFLAAGAIGGIAQVILTQVLFPGNVGALGASGAIQGIMGVLVVLAPRLTVLVMFVIPAPLWAFATFFVVLDLLGAISPGSQVAHFAHLAGLATGAAYAMQLKKQGLRVQTGPPRARQF